LLAKLRDHDRLLNHRNVERGELAEEPAALPSWPFFSYAVIRLHMELALASSSSK
jgi:hypothetical protein